MRSPYCYLALDRLLEIRERFDVDIKVRVVYPLAIRQPDFFKIRASKHYRSYNLLDTQRWSQYLKVPFRRPVPDPIVQERVGLWIVKAVRKSKLQKRRKSYG